MLSTIDLQKQAVCDFYAWFTSDNPNLGGETFDRFVESVRMVTMSGRTFHPWPVVGDPYRFQRPDHPDWQ